MNWERKHTILLSTHILPEVEVTCDHVLIIHKGKLAASGSLRELEEQAGSQSVITAEIDGEIEDIEPLRQKLSDAIRLETEYAGGVTRVKVTTDNPIEVSQRICALSIVQQWRIREVKPQKQTLEDLFVRITSEDGKDNGEP
ncbi:MAG: hypothetical protein KatS3mg105_0293 [Gemmatales bacterium]|nr:MAG: hypothetical protein KatS3mg105_0293 [Gemmatales bacterium]